MTVAVLRIRNKAIDMTIEIPDGADSDIGTLIANIDRDISERGGFWWNPRGLITNLGGSEVSGGDDNAYDLVWCSATTTSVEVRFIGGIPKEAAHLLVLTAGLASDDA